MTLRSLSLLALLILFSACRPESGNVVAGDELGPPAETATPQATDCSACPTPPAREPEIIVAEAKGDGPVRLFYPGLEDTPQLDATHRDALNAHLRERASSTSIPDEPGPGTRPEPTMNPPTMPEDEHEVPRSVPEGFRDRHNLRIAVEPYVTIDEEQGHAILRWETWIATPPSFVHFGLEVPDQLLKRPRFKVARRESGKEWRKQHKVVVGLDRFGGRRTDIADYREAGGTIDYRIEYFDSAGGLFLFREGRFSFTKQSDGTGWRAGVTLTEGPFVDVPTPTGVTLSLETEVPSLATVLALAPDGTRHLFDSTEASTRHEIPVTGLAPDTLYHYRVGVIDARGALGGAGDFAFRTAPETTRPFRFAVMSDSRSALGGAEHMTEGSNHKILREFTREAFKLGADFILFPGDLISGYTTARREFEIQLEAWKRATGPVHAYIPIIAGMGNHELYLTQKQGGPRYDVDTPDSTEDIFAAEFVNPTNGPPPEREGAPPYSENVFSFDYGKVHVVSVNTNYWISTRPGDTHNREGHIMDGQMAWIEADIQDARERGASFIFVFTHEPGFPNGGHVGDAMYWRGKSAQMNAMRNRFWKLMSDHRVDVVFHGDEHNYSRLRVDSEMNPEFTHPVWQIITGGCGAPHYARDTKVPWARRVARFSPMEHFVMVDVLSDTRAVITAIGRNGEKLDRFVLDHDAPSP